jgi:hypothetical protein
MLLLALCLAKALVPKPVKREETELLYPCPHPDRHQHGDAHPSLKINPKKDTWSCFVCGVERRRVNASTWLWKRLKKKSKGTFAPWAEQPVIRSSSMLPHPRRKQRGRSVT